MKSSLAGQMLKLLSPAGSRARLAVFCYHQVLDSKDPLRPGEPDSAEFRSDLQKIAETFNVLSLPYAAIRLKRRELPACAAVITFDDGYANNHEIAAPILDEFGMTATFYIATGAVDAGVMWNDLVIDGIAAAPAEVLREVFEIDEQSLISDSDRRALATAELQRLKYRPPDERWHEAESIYRCLTGASELPRKMMTREMVGDLSRRGFDIGGHTVSHPILTRISAEAAADEIQSCRAWIAEVCGEPPVSFAYPNGIPQVDFDRRHMQAAAESGFESATSTAWGIARSSDDSYSLPRVGPWWRLGGSFRAGLLRGYVKSYVRGASSA